MLATAESPRLPVILRAMNLASDNFIAETLVKDVGPRLSGGGDVGACPHPHARPGGRHRRRRQAGRRLGPVA